MKVVYQHIYSVMIFASLPYSLLANQTENFSRLNQIDATQQQRQQHIQQAQDKILQPQSDVRLDTTNKERLTLSNHEMPCYPIHRISLVDYSTTPTSSESQFQWAFDKAAHDLNLTLPHCFGGEGLGILMKQIQNRIIENTYNASKSVLPDNHLELWKKSIQTKDGDRWAKEVIDGKIIYHRFEYDRNFGTFHWNGSTAGKTQGGKERKIDLHNVPNEIKGR